MSLVVHCGQETQEGGAKSTLPRYLRAEVTDWRIKQQNILFLVFPRLRVGPKWRAVFWLL